MELIMEPLGTDPSKIANPNQRKFWLALGQIPIPLYAIVSNAGTRAELLGSLSLERSDGVDVIVLKGSGSHIHLNWAAISRVQYEPREDGYDCITFFDGDNQLLQVVPQNKAYRYPAELLSALADVTTELRA
jgi:hypothetical protein